MAAEHGRDPLELLRALGSGAPAPADAGERVRARLSESLLLDLALEAPRAGQDPTHPAGAAASVVPHRASVAQWTSRVLALRGSVVARVVSLIAAAGLGAGAHAVFAPERVRVIYVERQPAPAVSAMPAVSGPSEAGAASVSAESLPLEKPATATNPAQGAPTAQAVSAEASELQRERTLLDAARRSLTNGDAVACIASLTEHERAFPNATLKEEREALFVNALVIGGNYEEAKQRAEAFRRVHPHSFLAPSVEAAIRAIPGE